MNCICFWEEVKTFIKVLRPASRPDYNIHFAILPQPSGIWIANFWLASLSFNLIASVILLFWCNTKTELNWAVRWAGNNCRPAAGRLALQWQPWKPQLTSADKCDSFCVWVWVHFEYRSLNRAAQCFPDFSVTPGMLIKLGYNERSTKRSCSIVLLPD